MFENPLADSVPDNLTFKQGPVRFHLTWDICSVVRASARQNNAAYLNR
jgi:hypothetical protein